MMRTLAQTGNGWMTFKDTANRACNQTARRRGNVVHLSNLCTEILEVTSDGETAVCNLGSINLARAPDRPTARRRSTSTSCARTVRTGRAPARPRHRPQLLPDRQRRAASNLRWRPVGLGVMGLQDVFFQLRLPFDAPEARALSRAIAEEIYFHALAASCRAGRGARARTRRSPRRARRAASCSSTPGASRPTQPDALGRAARAHRRRTACATRC